jgi:hypothetical protein
VRRAGLALVLLVLLAAFGMACGGSGGPSLQTKETQSTDFAQLRDSLRAQLNGIGVNINSVPNDVLTQILNKCHELEKYADGSTVNNICDSIRRAHDNNDAAALDQVVTQLGQLKPK